MKALAIVRWRDTILLTLLFLIPTDDWPVLVLCYLWRWYIVPTGNGIRVIVDDDYSISHYLYSIYYLLILTWRTDGIVVEMTDLYWLFVYCYSMTDICCGNDDIDIDVTLAQLTNWPCVSGSDDWLMMWWYSMTFPVLYCYSVFGGDSSDEANIVIYLMTVIIVLVIDW